MIQCNWPLQPLLDRCGLGRREFHRRHGIKLSREVLSDVCADRYATAAGLHPVEVWGWAWVEAGLALDQEAAA